MHRHMCVLKHSLVGNRFYNTLWFRNNGRLTTGRTSMHRLQLQGGAQTKFYGNSLHSTVLCNREQLRKRVVGHRLDLHGFRREILFFRNRHRAILQPRPYSVTRHQPMKGKDVDQSLKKGWFQSWKEPFRELEGLIDPRNDVLIWDSFYCINKYCDRLPDVLEDFVSYWYLKDASWCDSPLSAILPLIKVSLFISPLFSDTLASLGPTLWNIALQLVTSKSRVH